MKVKQIHELAIELGMKNDLRGEARVKKQLAKINEKYGKLPEEAKKDFDKDLLENPYMDSQILFDNEREVKKVMMGVDIDTAELLMAKQLGDIDLVISHHPSGKGLAHLDKVMPLQVEVLAGYGVPINIAENLFKMRINEVSRGISPINHYKTADAAKHLDMNFMCAHTPCDNMVATFLKNKIEAEKFEYVGEVLKFLKQIPEYAEAMKRGAGPRLFAGHEDNYCGKIAVSEITGGTEGSTKIYEYMAQAGIGTVIGMHMSEEHKKQAEKHHINVIIAGHMSSDSIGMNLFLDELEKKGIEVVANSGLIRIKR